MKKLLAISIALTGLVLGSANVYACGGASHIPGPGEPVPACGKFNPAHPTKLVHFTYLPKQIDLKVGDTVAFAADGPHFGTNGSDPAVTLDSAGSMRALDVRYFRAATMKERGDEEQLWNAYEATQAGSFTVTAVFSAKPGNTPRTETVTINVTK